MMYLRMSTVWVVSGVSSGRDWDWDRGACVRQQRGGGRRESAKYARVTSAEADAEGIGKGLEWQEGLTRRGETLERHATRRSESSRTRRIHLHITITNDSEPVAKVDSDGPVAYPCLCAE